MELTRRRLLLAGGSGLATLGAARASYNVVLGYDSFTGTNVVEQDLDPLIEADLGPNDGLIATVEDVTIAIEQASLTVGHDGDTTQIAITEDGLTRARELESDLGLGEAVLSKLLEDLVAIDQGALRFVYQDYNAFFDRLAEHRTRPYTVQALRSRRTADPAMVEGFTGGDPADTHALVEDLADAFRERSYYDLPRYVAGSVEDNVIFGATDLRQHFESPTDFEALETGATRGLFCYELVFRSIEAFHSIPATQQVQPVFTGYVRNSRHKHAYTSIASVLRDGDELVIPVTFVDYTRATLYDDLRIRWLVGEGLDAYTERQRATEIFWSW